MRFADGSTPSAQPKYAFGFLRLLFASLVIVSHVPEIVDFNSDREILYQLTGHATFGQFAVYGFFVISGFLITGSLTNSTSIRSYLVKRVARIYPAFIVASLACLLIVAPLSGASFRGGLLHTVASSAAYAAVLARPFAEHPFAGQPYGSFDTGLNGAMWTIQYEFACYLFVMIFAAVGALRRRAIVPIVALVLIGIATFCAEMLPAWMSQLRLFPGQPSDLLLLTGMFLSGASFYLYRNDITFRRSWAVAATAGFVACLLNAQTAWLGYATFGSYLIFAAARAGSDTRLSKINDKTDISYGLYLYAWPIEMLLIRYTGTGSLIALGATTWVLAAAAGWASWTFVEKPVLNYVRDRR